MRNLCALAASVGLMACATVSVVSEDNTIRTSSAEIQSPVQMAAMMFCDTSMENGWIAETPDVGDLARVLISGRDEAASDVSAAQAQNEYLAALMLDLGKGLDGYAQLASDTGEAQALLSNVSQTVKALLADADPQALRRADLTSYERALVHAQQSRRVFAEAIDYVVRLQGGNSDAAYTRILAGYDHEIDQARALADQFAERYAHRNESATS